MAFSVFYFFFIGPQRLSLSLLLPVILRMFTPFSLSCNRVIGSQTISHRSCCHSLNMGCGNEWLLMEMGRLEEARGY